MAKAKSHPKVGARVVSSARLWKMKRAQQRREQTSSNPMPVDMLFGAQLARRVESIEWPETQEELKEKLPSETPSRSPKLRKRRVRHAK